MTRHALARSALLLAALLVSACATVDEVVHPPERAEIARIVEERDRRLSFATLVAAGVAVLPAVVHIVVRDLSE